MASLKKEFIHESSVPNNKIDISADPNIRAKVLKSKNDDELKIKFKGTSVDASIINALRRTILMKIPVYGFNRENIFVDVKKTRTMYNNHMLYNLFETLPLFDIDNDFDLEHPDIYLTGDLQKHLYGFFNNTQSKTVKKSKDKVLDIEISLNYRNTSENNVFITTHHLTLKINGNDADNYLNRPSVSILVLRPGEEISMRAVANLGIAQLNATYEATTNAIHHMISDTEYDLIYSTLGQLNKESIFEKACKIIIAKLNNLKKFLVEEYPDDRDPKEKINITLVGEEHTLGNLLSTVLQKCEYTDKAAYVMKSPFVNEIDIIYKLNKKSKKKPIKVIIDCISYLIKVFETIYEQIFG